MNFANKNSSCTYSMSDLAMGYAAAISSSLTVAISMRKLTSGMTATATGKKLLLLNTLVGCTAGSSAAFCNTYAMRTAEIKKGIEVFADEKLSENAGISKLAAKSAVTETALSRMVLSCATVGSPAALILTLGAMGIAP